jgi:hypothetical protein
MLKQSVFNNVAMKVTQRTYGHWMNLRLPARCLVALVSSALLLVPFTTLTLPVHSFVLSREPGVFSSANSLALATSKNAQAETSSIYGPYWYLDDNTSSVIEVTNNADVSQTVTPSLLLKGIERIQLDPVSLPAHATKRISLNHVLGTRFNGGSGTSREPRWGDGSRNRSWWGSATLQSELIEHLAGKILTENAQESLAVHSGFYQHGGGNLSATWWLPTSKSVALFALQNASTDAMQVSTVIYLDDRVIAGRNLSLLAGQSRLVDLRELLPEDVAKRRLPETGLVRFVAQGATPALFGRTVIFDEQRGFSVPLAMRDRTARTTNTLQMPGAPFGRLGRSMGFPASTKFTTQLLLTNVSNQPIQVTTTLDGRNAIGLPVSWNLPVIELKPLASRVLDLDNARHQGRSPIADGYAGIRLTHTGSALDLSAEAVTTDQTLKFSFDNEFYDTDLVARIYHAVSFNLTGNKNTLLLVKNSSDRAVQFGYKLNYERQGITYSYKAALAELKPYELKVVDVKTLRDSGVKDANGHVLPPDVQFGNANIYSNQPIVAGDPNFDAVAGISSSCIGPCGEFVPPYCDPCFLDPSLCPQNCPDTCTPCRESRNNREILCYSVLAGCEAPLAAAYNSCLNGCENMAFCRQGDPNYNQQECDRCRDGCLNTFLIASAGCGAAFGACIITLPDCTGSDKKRSDCSACSN